VARRSHHSDALYRQRLLAAAASVLLAAVLVVRWWPADFGTASSLPYSDRGAESIQIEEVQPTSQSQEKTPPPPAPLPPVVVPNDRLIETEIDWDTGTLQIEDPGDDATYQEGTTAQASASRTPDTNARLLRAVQPEYPSAARKDDVKARVVVEVQVSANGQVTSAQILERAYLENGQPRAVSRLGHGLEQAALAAARRSLFRPARANGQPVATRTTITYTFGD
jgi:TonB family protein